MIISILGLTFAAGKAQEGLVALELALRGTKSADGCLGVEVIRHVQDSHSVTIIERWESLEHDHAYRAEAASHAGSSPLRGLMAGPRTLTVGERLDGL